MTLHEKYKELIEAANTESITNLQVKEKDKILYINGEAVNGAAKDRVWEVYENIDPNFRSSEVIIDITVIGGAGTNARVIIETPELHIRKGPGTDQPVIGKAKHNEMVTLLSKTSDQWWLIKTNADEEGYAFAQYLNPE